MNEENPLNAFIVGATRKKGRPKKRLRDIIKLGKGSEVIVRPTTKQSQAAMGNYEIKEEINIFKLLRRKRKRKPSNGKLIRRNMKASGSFPPLQPAAMSESDLKCNEDLEVERRARNKRTWGACKRALGREKEIYKFRDDDELTRGDE